MTIAGTEKPAIGDEAVPDDAELQRLIERQRDLADQLGEASRQVLDALLRRAGQDRAGRWTRPAER